GEQDRGIGRHPRNGIARADRLYVREEGAVDEECHDLSLLLRVVANPYPLPFHSPLPLQGRGRGRGGSGGQSRSPLCRRSTPATRAICWRCHSSSPGGVANQASRISLATASEVARRLIASTLAAFQMRAPRAVSASAQSAARTPGTLFAA